MGVNLKKVNINLEFVSERNLIDTWTQNSIRWTVADQGNQRCNPELTNIRKQHSSIKRQ